MLDLRQECFARAAEVYTQCQDTIVKKANYEDFKQVVEEKADAALVKSHLASKVGTGEFDALKQLVEKVSAELSGRAHVRDLQQTNTLVKTSLEGVAKDLLLKASIKDVCQLLDEKANIADVNQTFEAVQREVDLCVREPRIKEVLDDQALVNEALCAENCVGRWIWKSGDL